MPDEEWQNHGKNFIVGANPDHPRNSLIVSINKLMGINTSRLQGWITEKLDAISVASPACSSGDWYTVLKLVKLAAAA